MEHVFLFSAVEAAPFRSCFQLLTALMYGGRKSYFACFYAKVVDTEFGVSRAQVCHQWRVTSLPPVHLVIVPLGSWMAHIEKLASMPQQLLPTY